MDITSFRIDLTYSDQELLAYEAIALRHQTSQVDRYPWYSWAIMASGAFVALIVAAVALVLGIATRSSGSLVAVLIFAGFYLGMLAPTFWAWVLAGRTRQARWAAFQRRWAGTTLRVSAHGLSGRHPHMWVHYAWSAVERVAREGDLIVLWMTGEPPFAIPARVLTPDQAAFLLSKPGTGMDQPAVA